MLIEQCLHYFNSTLVSSEFTMTESTKSVTLWKRFMAMVYESILLLGPIFFSILISSILSSVFVGNNDIDFEVPGTLGVIYNYKKWRTHKKGYPFLEVKQYMSDLEKSDKMNIIYTLNSDLCNEFLEKIKNDKTAVILVDTSNKHGVAEQRKFLIDLINNKIRTPVIIGRSYQDLSDLKLQLSTSVDFGALLLDGIGDTIRVSLSDDPVEEVKVGNEILKSLNLRHRGVKIISCPSCARQGFQVIETVKVLEQKLSHIKTPITLSIIGCVVNGPGEAAMTDIGITGGKKGNNMLYLSGVQAEKVLTNDMIDRVVSEVEKKASELEKD